MERSIYLEILRGSLICVCWVIVLAALFYMFMKGAKYRSKNIQTEHSIPNFKMEKICNLGDSEIIFLSSDLFKILVSVSKTNGVVALFSNHNEKRLDIKESKNISSMVDKIINKSSEIFEKK